MLKRSLKSPPVGAIMKGEAGGLDRIHLGIGHAICEHEIKDLWGELVEGLNPEETFYGEITPAVGVHSGTGTIAIAWIEPL